MQLDLFEKHVHSLGQTNRLVAGIDLDNGHASNVIMYIRMETEFDDQKKKKIESGRLWLSGAEFLQLASLLIHIEELFKTTHEKGTVESRAKMKSFREAWRQLKTETWG